MLPLKTYPKIRQFQLNRTGEIGDYRYEVRLNGRSKEQIIPFGFFFFKGKEIFLVIYQEKPSEILGQTLLSVYTAVGKSIRMSEPSLESLIQSALQIAEEYIADPNDFSQEIDDNNDFLPSLTYYPQLKSSQLVEAASIGDYRYELHTSCASIQKIQYIHVLFCYAPFESDPCLAVSAETLGKLGYCSIGLFSERGHSNLGSQGDIHRLGAFREAALRILRKELGMGEIEIAFPQPQNGVLVEKGLIGNYRCELYTDCESVDECLYVHIFALFVGSMKQPEFLFALEKRPGASHPCLVLYQEERRIEMGFEPALLDVKIFRDRVVTLLKIILSEKMREERVGIVQAHSLLRLHRFYQLSLLCSLTALMCLSFDDSLSALAWIPVGFPVVLSTACYGFAVLCWVISLRFARQTRFRAFVLSGILLCPFYSPLFTPLAFASVLLSLIIFKRYAESHQCDYNAWGLSWNSKERLLGITLSSPLARSYLS